MKPTYDEYMAALAAELRVEGTADILAASHASYMRSVQDQMALCRRVGEQLDEVPRMLVRMVTRTEGA